MARLRYAVCARRDCPELVLIGEGSYCREHRPPAWNGRTGTSRTRASGLSGWAAQAAAREALSRFPVCYACRSAPSVEADHLIPLAWGRVSELRGICVPCHRRKTAEERAIGRRFKPYVPPEEIIRRHMERWRNGR